VIREVKIRKGTVDDLKEIKQLFVETISSVCKHDYNSEQIEIWTSSTEDQNRWSNIILNQLVLIAIFERHIVGFATLMDSNHIDLFYVHKDYQGKKIAGMLYAEIEKEALREKQKVLSSNVSITAKHFFKRMGFKVIKRQTVLRKKVKFTNYKMKKELNESNG